MPNPPKKSKAAAKWKQVALGAPAGAPSPIATPDPLSPNALRFVDEYLIDLNATQAYLRAYPNATPATADTNGPRMLGNARVAALIAEKKAERAASTGITARRVLQEVARLAFFDPRKLFDKNGAPLPISELDDDTAAALAGLDVVEEFEGSGEARKFVGYTKKYKLVDKGANLDRLMKHLGLFGMDNTQQVNPLDALLASLGRSALPVVKDALRDD